MNKKKHYPGLTTAEVEERRKKYGFNELKTKKEFTALKILLSQFTSFLIIILIIAGSVSLILDEVVDSLVIFAIVVINAGIGFFQEYKAENAVKALKKMVVPTTIVVRNGQEMEIEIRELVPDDIVILNEGDKIPADLELIEAYSLKVDEAILTGESVASNKSAEGKENEKLLFKGTIITTGRAKAKVVHTGMKTEFGKIVGLVSKQEKDVSPLTKQLNNLGKRLGIFILILIVALFFLGTLRDFELFDMLMTSVALGVSAIPEGMPIIVTLTLAMGVTMLAKKNAIVRKMNAIETLGATTVICSDKTGTLTLNEMTVKKSYAGFKEKDIPGQGYDTDTKIKLETKEEEKLAEICENCNNSFVDKNIIGDPTEIALKIFNRKAEFVKKYEELDENVFTSERKMMSSLHKVGKKKEIYAKGAFEEIIKRCTRIMENGEVRDITQDDKEKLTHINEKYAEKALRVLAFACKEHKKSFDEQDLIFVGLIGMLDPPRESVKESIATAQKAGIKVKIITGDNPITAKAIGEQIGLEAHNIVIGKEIDQMNDDELNEVIKKTEIFARTKPQHKYRIVDLLKRNNEVVSVTGDGVNDAPALKHSDVGIAMGIKGTEATKEVADIVLKDDNFSTIVNTIEEGRRIYHNILAFIKYMISSNFDTIFAVGILTIMGYPLPILPLQILWINLVTDSLPALALGKSKASPNIMEEKPHPKEEKILMKFLGFIFIAVLFQTVTNMTLYFYGTGQDNLLGIDTANLDIPSHARTLVFTGIVLFELCFVFVCKEEKSINWKTFTSNKYLIGAVLLTFVLQIMMLYAPFMQNLFKTVPLNVGEWIALILFSLTAFLVPPIQNFFRKIKAKLTSNAV